MKSIAIISLLTLLVHNVKAEGVEMEVGHVYTYQNRINEGGSRFTVLKIDDINGTKVVSVTISGLKFINPHAPGGISESVGHMPVALAAIMASRPVDTGESVKIEWPNEGYDTWMSAVADGQAGYWTLSLSECLDAMESEIRK